ncbi:MAG: hypothetical protein HRT45_15205 [Bdellovibrionales bacterium]|nr:hypothetical protein [Bdellovibrionales bacterium]
MKNIFYIFLIIAGVIFAPSSWANNCRKEIAKSGSPKQSADSGSEAESVLAVIEGRLQFLESELELTEEDLKPSFFIEDKSYIKLGDDPFVNRVCRKATRLVLQVLEESGADMTHWAEYLTVYSQNEMEQMTKAAENATDEEQYNQMVAEVPFMKYMDGIDHSVAFNPASGLLVDLTYRQFLKGKIPEEEFSQLPRYFVGSLPEFRLLMSPFMTDAGVDRMLTSAEVDYPAMATEIAEKPTLLEFESGLKTLDDVFSEADVQAALAALYDDEDFVFGDEEDFVVADPEPIPLIEEPVIIVEDPDSDE